MSKSYEVGQGRELCLDVKRTKSADSVIRPWIQGFVVRLACGVARVTLDALGALAVVLWYHTRLISERSPARFPAGRTKKTFLFTLHTIAVTFPTDVIDVRRHLSRESAVSA
jgi:hypothetical protein